MAQFNQGFNPSSGARNFGAAGTPQLSPRAPNFGGSSQPGFTTPPTGPQGGQQQLQQQIQRQQDEDNAVQSLLKNKIQGKFGLAKQASDAKQAKHFEGKEGGFVPGGPVFSLKSRQLAYEYVIQFSQMDEATFAAMTREQQQLFMDGLDLIPDEKAGKILGMKDATPVQLQHLKIPLLRIMGASFSRNPVGIQR
tara:strand:- start:4301 stop:4882 length:582 start_codon:yes stop_codon:yes gene_type:complete